MAQRGWGPKGHRMSVRWGSRWAVGAACLLAACSSSSSPGNGDGGSASGNNFTCGGGSLTGQARATDVMSLGPIAGATVSAPGCTTAVTDDRGYVTAASDPGLVIKLSLSASGYVNAYSEFSVVKSGFQESGADYATSAATNLIPQLSSTNGYIFISTSGDGSDGGACSDGKGSSLTVKDHPELTPAYLSSQTTIDTTLTATAGFGTLFGPMPPGTYEVDGTKTGCKTVGHNDGYFQFNASSAVLANTVTLFSLQLTPQ